MDKAVTGACGFCGQTRIISLPEDEWLQKFRETGKTAEEIADTLAEEMCDCKDGREWRAEQIMMKECGQNIDELFGEHHPEIAELFQEAKELVWKQQIKKISISNFEDGTASMYRSGGNMEIKFIKKNETKLTVSEK